jgi:hypothetical protein
MADFSANDLFENLQNFKSKYIKEEMQGRENDVKILMEMSHLLDLDLRFTFNPVKEASLDVGFHRP